MYTGTPTQATSQLMITDIQKEEGGAKYYCRSQYPSKSDFTQFGTHLGLTFTDICYILLQVLDFLNMKVFVDTDSDIRLSRRLNRDIRHRGRDLASVLEQVQGDSGV